MAVTVKDIPKSNIIPKACRERFLPVRAPSARPLRERGVVMSGLSDLVAPYQMGRPDPPFHVVLYTLAGRGRLRTPRAEHPIRPGTVLVAPARIAYWYGSGAVWRIAWFHFAEEERREAFAVSAPAVRAASSTGGLLAAMEGFIAESVGPSPDAARAAEAYAEIIGIHLDRELGPRGGPASRRTARELNVLWRSVHADLRRPWTVADLAEAMHVSEVHLHRIVRRLHGATPLGVVTRMRMQRAEELLRNTDYPLKLIADLVGYQTPFAFSRAFKRHAGASPKAFRAGSARSRR